MTTKTAQSKAKKDRGLVFTHSKIITFILTCAVTAMKIFLKQQNCVNSGARWRKDRLHRHRCIVCAFVCAGSYVGKLRWWRWCGDGGWLGRGYRSRRKGEGRTRCRYIVVLYSYSSLQLTSISRLLLHSQITDSRTKWHRKFRTSRVALVQYPTKDRNTGNSPNKEQASHGGYIHGATWNVVRIQGWR